MIITVNNKLAVLKKDTSFDYVSENRLFSGSDDYSLTISFPLRGCAENIAIFGNINRADVATQKVRFDCEITDRNFYKTGTLTIVEINEVEVKTQFLEGRSEQNFSDSLADIYINKLDLGKPESYSLKNYSPDRLYGLKKYVPLPWLNSTTNVISNKVKWNASGKYFEWHEDTLGLSWQPRLFYITTKICEAIGYEYDFYPWMMDDFYGHLIICNAIPFSWNNSQNFNKVLPHWTVEEFFSNLELLLDGEFDFDHRNKKISFRFSSDIISNFKEEVIENVIDEHNIEVDDDSVSCDYIYSKTLAYADGEHQVSGLYDCYDTLHEMVTTLYTSNLDPTPHTKVTSYKTLEHLVNANKKFFNIQPVQEKKYFIDHFLYAEDVDLYFTLRYLFMTSENRMTGDYYRCMLQPVNAFGPKFFGDPDNSDKYEIKFIPVCIDWVSDDVGKIMILPCNENAVSSERANVFNDNFVKRAKNKKGDSEQTAYDKIYIAFWTGYQPAATDGHVFFPFTGNCEVSTDFTKVFKTADFHKDWISRSDFSLRLNTRDDKRFASIPLIDPKRKVTFKFLSSSLPNARAIFNIRGKRYLCEKITATFTAEAGMSKLFKGVFYPVKD